MLNSQIIYYEFRTRHKLNIPPKNVKLFIIFLYSCLLSSKNSHVNTLFDTSRETNSHKYKIYICTCCRFIKTKIMNLKVYSRPLPREMSNFSFYTDYENYFKLWKSFRIQFSRFVRTVHARNEIFQSRHKSKRLIGFFRKEDKLVDKISKSHN